MTSETLFLLVSAIIYALMGLLHAVRLALGWHVQLESRVVPMRVSIAGLALGVAMSVWAIWLLL